MPLLIATSYLPPALYMAEIAKADEIIVEAFETYTKQTCRNHCLIYGPNGRQTLSIPVIKVNGNHTITKDIRISTHQPWQKTHWRSIKTAYSNSPFFLFYQDYLSPFYEKKFNFLIDLNIGLLETLMHIMHIHCEIRLSAYFEKSPAGVIDQRTEPVAKHCLHPIAYPHYTQVFEPRHGFIPGLSILDVLLNLGPETSGYLKTLQP